MALGSPWDEVLCFHFCHTHSFISVSLGQGHDGPLGSRGYGELCAREGRAKGGAMSARRIKVDISYNNRVNK